MTADGAPGASFQLYCFAHAGGGAGAYRDWQRALGSEVIVRAVQFPGRENRLLEAPYEDLRALVSSIIAAVDFPNDRPYSFFGHSLGALVAFELARELRRRGCQLPTTLFASAYSAPHLARRRRPISALPDAEFISELNGYDATPHEVLRCRELMALLLPGLRADFRLHEAYAYAHEAPLDMSIVALGGIDDPMVSANEIAAWRQHCKCSFDLRLFPGGHFYLRDTAALRGPNGLYALLRRRIADSHVAA